MSIDHASRREFLSFTARGIGATAALSLMMREGQAAPTHFPAKPKLFIHICLCGGLIQVDTFDYKPELAKRHGQPLGGSEKPDVFFGQVGLLRKNDWAFKQRGKSGLWVSDLFPQLAGVADDLTVIRSMVADTANHTPGLFVLNTGFQFNGYPSLGCWLAYGLGSETDELPAYVVLPDGR